MGLIPSSAGHADFTVLLQIGDSEDIPGAMIYDTGLYDTNVYGESGEAYMQDVTEYVEGIPSIVTGRQQYTGRFRTGTCTIDLDNTNGEWTPNAGAPLPGSLILRPGRLMQIFVSVDGGSPIQLYEGFIDTITDRYGRDGNLITRVKALDLLSLLTLNDLPAVPPEGSGEFSYERITRILEHHFLTPPPVQFLTFDASEWTTMQPTELAQKALQEIQITADSEGGGVWVDPTGDLMFPSFDWFGTKADGTEDWSVGVGEVRAWAIGNTDWSASRVRNEAHYAKTGGTEQVVANSGSIAKYGRRTHTRLDLETDDDARVSALALRLVTNLQNDRAQVTEMALQPSNTDEANMAALARIGDVVLLNVSTIRGWSYTLKTQIFGRSDTVDESTWQVSFLLDDTEIVERGAYSSGFSDGYDV